MTKDHLGKTYETKTFRIEYWAELGSVDGGGMGYWDSTYYSSGPYADRRDAVNDLINHPDVGKHRWQNFEGMGLGNNTDYGTLRVRSEHVFL